MSEESSCSDCKLELVQKKWTQLLLNWLNVCVYCTPPDKEMIMKLNPWSLVEIVNRYKNDICATDIDRAILCTDDLEPFLRYKYPIFRLRYFFEEKDQPKKMYMMTSILLYHCCVNSLKGVVISDICEKMDQEEQEMVVVFCERVGEMEITLHNVETAIKDACHRNTPPVESKNIKNLSREASIKSVQKSFIAVCPETGSFSDPSKKLPMLKFKSSVTVMPSCIAEETSSYTASLHPATSTSEYSESSKNKDSSDRTLSDNDVTMTMNSLVNLNDPFKIGDSSQSDDDKKFSGLIQDSDNKIMDLYGQGPPCKPGCACSRCSISGPCCGIPGSVVDCDSPKESKRFKSLRNIRHWLCSWPSIIAIVIAIFALVLATIWLKSEAPPTTYDTTTTEEPLVETSTVRVVRMIEETTTLSVTTTTTTKPPPLLPIAKWAYDCKQGYCYRVLNIRNANFHASHSRCILLCMGPQIWPWPIGFFTYSKKLVAIETNKLEYNIHYVPSEIVRQYLGDAFKLFLADLARLEKSYPKSKKNLKDIMIYKMILQLDVDSDKDPRLRLNTDESYLIRIDESNKSLKISISSASFCGIRHGLETLRQMILLDESSGYLITLANISLKDAPTYRYRGIMLDTGRNYIPIPDIIKVLDAMAMNKLNTFHWRISDSTSFPLVLDQFPELFEYGAYSRELVYTSDDVKTVVRRSIMRGIRVVIEVALPGPVGRAWSWFSSITCKKKSANRTCDHVLCLRLRLDEQFFDILQKIYENVINLTGVEDVFHMSDSVFSLINCYSLIEDRIGFLEKALYRLKMANNGFTPQLPLIWYTPHLWDEREQVVWDKMGIQLSEWEPNKWIQNLRNFRVIHSANWDLSCEIKKQRCYKYRTWQVMYASKFWLNVQTYMNEGGEAILWTDFVSSTTAIPDTIDNQLSLALRIAAGRGEVKVTYVQHYKVTFTIICGQERLQWLSVSGRIWSSTRLSHQTYTSGLTITEARVDCLYSSIRKRCASMLCGIRASPNRVLAMIAGRLDSVYMSHCSAIHADKPQPKPRF